MRPGTGAHECADMRKNGQLYRKEVPIMPIQCNPKRGFWRYYKNRRGQRIRFFGLPRIPKDKTDGHPHRHYRIGSLLYPGRVTRRARCLARGRRYRFVAPLGTPDLQE